jgi:hypothetical protein
MRSITARRILLGTGLAGVIALYAGCDSKEQKGKTERELPNTPPTDQSIRSGGVRTDTKPTTDPEINYTITPSAHADTASVVPPGS